MRKFYTKVKSDNEVLEKENNALRSQVGIGNDKSTKIAVGMSDEEVRAIKEKFEKEAFQSRKI